MVPARLTYQADAGYCDRREDTGDFWLFHNPGFCISGGRFAQPVGGLRDDFSFDECGSLDAPECICLGGIGSDITVHHENGKRYISERSMVFRDHIADMEARADDHAWAPWEDDYVYHDEDLPPEPAPNTCIHVEPLHTIGRDVWCASINGIDLSGPLGWGDTQQQAIDSLIEEASARRLIGYQAAHALPVREVRT